MVQGLGFLAKKSWHVKNKNNQEKVWLAEQRKETEDRKMKELADQIKQEREEEEMNQIVGRTKKLDRGIDWMYQGQSKDSEIAKEDDAKKAEEYLLGKAFVPEGVPKGDLDGGHEDEGVNRVVKTVTETQHNDCTTYKEPTVHERNEAFRMRHEDPMFAVTMQQREKEHSYERKKELFERVMGGEAVEKSKRHKKKKEHKKDRKRKHRHRSRSRSPGRERKHRRRSPSLSDSGPSGDDRCGRYCPSYKELKSRNSHRGGGDEGRYQSRKLEDERDHIKHGTDKSCAISWGESSHMGGRSEDARRYSRDAPSNQPERKYGLQGRIVDKANLGPDNEMLRRKRAERDEERQRKLMQSSRRSMSREERSRALEEMEADARRRSSAPLRFVHELSEREDDRTRGHGSFLNDVAREAHGLDSTLGIRDRLKQNRGRSQRERESFLCR